MEHETETPTEGTQDGAALETAPSGDEAETVATDSPSLTLAEINEMTGMNYKDKETALKSIKDMKSQAGKAADLEGKIKAAKADPKTSDETVLALQEQLNSLTEKLNQSELNAFYSQNPDINRDLVETIAKANNITPQEAIETDLYKNTVASPSKRTVAASNNRQPQQSQPFNPEDHAGDADALAKYVTETYLTK